MSAAQINIETIGSDGAELARYQISAGERVLMGWRCRGGVEVTDRPVEGRARAYVVDRGMFHMEQLAAFVGEYVEHAERLDACPMSREAIGEIVGGTEGDALASLLGEEV